MYSTTLSFWLAIILASGAFGQTYPANIVPPINIVPIPVTTIPVGGAPPAPLETAPAAIGANKDPRPPPPVDGVSFNVTLKEYNFDGKILGGKLPSLPCALAYSKKLDCSPHLYQFRNEPKDSKLFTEANLKGFCTAKCIDSLNAWEKDVYTACSPYKDMLKTPAAGERYLAQGLMNKGILQKMLYWKFCMTDDKTTKYCLLKPSKASSAKGTGNEMLGFCDDSCIVQKAYLINEVAKSEAAKSYAQMLADKLPDPASVCPSFDPAKLPLNAKKELDRPFGDDGLISVGDSGYGFNTSSLPNITIAPTAGTNGTGIRLTYQGMAMRNALTSIWTVTGIAFLVALLI